MSSSSITRLGAVLTITLAALIAPAGAIAHGDPSSHYLETDQLYPGFANRPSQQVELELTGLLEAARQAGYPIKVGIVGSVDDLTEDPSMYKTPQRYAESVSAALGTPNVKAPVLIVTPNGLGISGAQELGGRLAPVRRTDAGRLLGGVRSSPTATGDELAQTAMTAVRRIATAGGHPLPQYVAPAKVLTSNYSADGSGLGMVLPALLFAAVFFSAWLWFEVRGRVARRAARTALSLNPPILAANPRRRSRPSADRRLSKGSTLRVRRRSTLDRAGSRDSSTTIGGSRPS